MKLFYKTHLGKLYLGDCFDVAKKVDDNSVDLILFSPPYDKARVYDKDTNWEFDIHDFGLEVKRVLKDGGVCVVVMQDESVLRAKTLSTFRFTVDWVDKKGLRLFECCIYERHGLPGVHWKKRFRVDHEYIMIFFKGKDLNYFDKSHMNVRSGSATHGVPKYRSSYPIAPFRSAGKEVYGREGGIKTRRVCSVVPDEKCCGTIMQYGHGSQENLHYKTKFGHPATFPDKLAYDFIRCFTKKGDLVYDPLVGSGTTIVNSELLDRKWIASELSKKYCSIAKKRLKEDCKTIWRLNEKVSSKKNEKRKIFKSKTSNR